MNTAIGLMALAATKDEAHAPVIKAARAFLLSLQVDEGEGVTPDHPQYGGIGYDSKGIPDMQNLVWSVMALRETDPGTGTDSAPTGSIQNGNVWDRAMKFLSRCQNLKGSNDQSWALEDGGFVYASEPESKVEGNPTQSYGTMTYAGLLSFLYCRASKDDPRVKAAYEWVRCHYTVEENPFMGAQGLFYGYHVMSKSLNVFGESILVDAKNRSHPWRTELIRKLAALQNKEGYWVNAQSSRWLEDCRELVTAYAILTLEQSLADLPKKK